MKGQVTEPGTVGLPTAVQFARFFDVVGYDISLDKLEKSSKLIAVFHSPVEADVYVTIVNAGINGDNTLDMLAIFDLCNEIARLQSNALVAIESTVAVGACRQIAERFGFKRLVHCPHRCWSGDSTKYDVVRKRILGALNEESLMADEEFYFKANIPLHKVLSLEVAELAKITENAYRFVEIAFAESLTITCKKFAISFEEVKTACNTLKRPEYDYHIQVLDATDGVGGHCLPKDTRYLLSVMRSELLEGAILTDKFYKLWQKKLKEEIENYA
ncbi:hypothetical protein HXY32_01395 [Candidatus Bathyarchaeota archaeon]|nr:hypothetical protein [Candidatus Bathyarchaeota archaeon]